MKRKLKKVKVKSMFEGLTKDKMMKLVGGASCTTSGSSSTCDGTAVCNCKPHLEGD